VSGTQVCYVTCNESARGPAEHTTLLPDLPQAYPAQPGRRASRNVLLCEMPGESAPRPAADIRMTPKHEWINQLLDAVLTHDEGIWRSQACGCNAPVRVSCGDTLWLVRCGHCARLIESHQVYPEHFV
jgi:hypothetical protein